MAERLFAGIVTVLSVPSSLAATKSQPLVFFSSTPSRTTRAASLDPSERVIVKVAPSPSVTGLGPASMRTIMSPSSSSTETTASPALSSIEYRENGLMATFTSPSPSSWVSSEVGIA